MAEQGNSKNWACLRFMWKALLLKYSAKYWAEIRVGNARTEEITRDWQRFWRRDYFLVLRKMGTTGARMKQ